MRITGIIAAASVLSACSTELTQGGAQVRQISAQASDTCEFLGPVTVSESMGATVAMDVESAFNQARNEVAQRGGNAFVVSSTSTSMATTVVQADIYDC